MTAVATLAGAPLTGPIDWNKGQPEREAASGAYREVATDLVFLLQRVLPKGACSGLSRMR